MSTLYLEANPEGMGATAHGVDCGAAQDAATCAEIINALHTHRFLVFPQQTLSSRAQREFTETLGPLEGHINKEFQGDAVPEVHVLSNLDNAGNPKGPERPSGTE